MRILTMLTMAFALLASLGALASIRDHQGEGLRALEGVWIYVDDITQGRPLEQLGPPMSSTFSMRVEDDAVILVSGHGSGHKDVRIALDGSMTEVEEPEKTTRYRGNWNDGVFSYQVDFLRGANSEPDGLIRREFRITDDGLIVRAAREQTEGFTSVAIYRHEEDIPLPTPTKATIDDLSWMSGAWVGKRGSGGAISIEERWSPPLGGAMLAVSRTVARGKMSAFEFLRVVEREEGLVYIAQPGGGKPTEFVLTELSPTRAVFDNPRHDYPKRITYELSGEGGLSATIGFMKGGTPRRFEFRRESQ